MNKNAPKFENWEERFDFIDRARCGCLDYPQFKAAALDREYILSEHNLEKVFKIFDSKH
jgi:Ca2+-binding EF-hand superfamily protein